MAKKKKFIKLSNNNWVITLFSTMIGVVAGFYLTNYNAEKALLKAKNAALNQVQVELSENKNNLKDYHELLKPKFRELAYVFTKLSPENDILIHADSLDTFKANCQNIFEFESAAPIDNGMLNVRGDLNLDFNSRLVISDLSDLVWESYKQTNYLSVTNFQCLTSYESIYVQQEEFNAVNAEWRKQFFAGDFIRSPESRDEFMQTWQSLMTKQKMLLEFYQMTDGIIKECE